MPVVDVQFRLTGKTIPVDHGYRLFSAVSEVIHELHERERFGIAPIFGRLTGDRNLTLSDNSFLTIRLPSEEIKKVLPIAGKTFRIGDSEVRVGVPHTKALVPSARLYTHLATQEPEELIQTEGELDAAFRQRQAEQQEGYESAEQAYDESVESMLEEAKEKADEVLNNCPQ